MMVLGAQILALFGHHPTSNHCHCAIFRKCRRLIQEQLSPWPSIGCRKVLLLSQYGLPIIPLIRNIANPLQTNRSRDCLDPILARLECADVANMRSLSFLHPLTWTQHARQRSSCLSPGAQKICRPDLALHALMLNRT